MSNDKKDKEEKEDEVEEVTIGMASIEIISPIAGKGLDREYLARPNVMDEKNYLEIGLVVYDEKGKSMNEIKVKVETTDKDQNVKLKGTGNMTNIVVNGIPVKVYYYPFHYDFRTIGNNTIKFTAGALSKEIILEAPEDTRED